MGSGFKIMTAGGLILTLISVVLLFGVVEVAVPLLVTSGTAVNATGIPFGSFFLAGGIIFLALGAGVVLTVLGGFGINLGSKR